MEQKYINGLPIYDGERCAICNEHLKESNVEIKGIHVLEYCDKCKNHNIYNEVYIIGKMKRIFAR